MDKYKGEYDKMYMDTTEVEAYTDNMRLLVQRYRGKLLVSHRDFTFLAKTQLNPADGTAAVVCQSVVDPRLPPAKGYVRGSIIVRRL